MHGWWVWPTKKSTLAHLQESFTATYCNCIGQALTSPNVPSEQSKTQQANFYEIFKNLTNFLLYSPTYSLTDAFSQV